MKLCTLLVALLTPCLCSSLLVTWNGSAEGEVTQYITYAVPSTMPGQLAECDVSVPAVFRGGSYRYSCHVVTVPEEREEYAGGFLEQTPETALNPEGEAISESLQQENDFDTVLSVVRWVETEIVYDPAYGDLTNACRITLDQRKGSCDELSLVTIGMLRHAGIPARYVSGLTFDGNRWVQHAWIEAAIEGVWVPFDPTAKQHGFVDGYHIAYSKGDVGVLDQIEGEASWEHELHVDVQETKKVFDVFFDTPETLGYGSHGLFVARATTKVPNRVALEPRLITELSQGAGFQKIWSVLDESFLGEGIFKWVLKAPDYGGESRYAVPVTLVLQDALTRDVEVGPTAESPLEVYSNATHYSDGMAEYLVFGRDVLEVETGATAKGPRSVFVLPASQKTAFLSHGSFLTPASVVADSFPIQVEIDAPSEVKAGKAFTVSVRFYGPKKTELQTMGEKYTLEPGTELKIETSLSETSEISFRFSEIELKKRVRATRMGLIESLFWYLKSVLGKL